MMLATVADAARVLDREDYHDMAVRAGEFALRELRRPNGRLVAHLAQRAGQAERLPGGLRVPRIRVWWSCTRRRSIPGGSRRRASWRTPCWRTLPIPAGGFFDTSEDHETLITRPKDVQDNATPSGNAMAATVLAQLAALTGDSRYRRRGGAGAAARGALRRRACHRVWAMAVCGRFHARGRARGRDRGRPRRIPARAG